MKRIITSLGALALAAALSLGLVGGLSASAQARTVPVVYQYDGLRQPHAYVRPGHIYISMVAPYAINLHWSSWNARSARATGRLEVNDCVPSCAAGTTQCHGL